MLLGVGLGVGRELLSEGRLKFVSKSGPFGEWSDVMALLVTLSDKLYVMALAACDIAG